MPPPLSWDFSNPTIWTGDMGQKLHFSRSHRAVQTQNLCLEKIQPSLVLELFKSDYLENGYMGQNLHFSGSHRAVQTQNLCLEKMIHFCLRIVQIWLFGEEIWDKNCIFQHNIGMWVLKIFFSNEWLHCLGIFQIQLLGGEIWGKNHIFHDRIGLWMHKMSVLEKWPPFVLDVFKSDDLERRYGATTAFFNITYGWRKDPLLSWNWNCSNQTTWRGDMGQKLHFPT